MMGLTAKEKALFSYIQESTARSQGVCPCYDQMREAMGLKSKSGVHRLVSQLEAKGAIRRIPHMARAIEIVKQPAGWKPDETHPTTGVPYLARGADSPAIVHVFDVGNGPLAVEDLTPVYGLTEWCEVPA